MKYEPKQERLFDAVLLDLEAQGFPPPMPDEHYGEPTEFEVGQPFMWPCGCFRTSHPFSGKFFRGERCEGTCNAIEDAYCGKYRRES